MATVPYTVLRVLSDTVLLTVCSGCGLVVGDRAQHDTWHAIQDELMSRALGDDRA